MYICTYVEKWRNSVRGAVIGASTIQNATLSNWSSTEITTITAITDVFVDSSDNW